LFISLDILVIDQSFILYIRLTAVIVYLLNCLDDKNFLLY